MVMVVRVGGRVGAAAAACGDGGGVDIRESPLSVKMPLTEEPPRACHPARLTWELYSWAPCKQGQAEASKASKAKLRIVMSAAGPGVLSFTTLPASETLAVRFSYLGH